LIRGVAICTLGLDGSLGVSKPGWLDAYGRNLDYFYFIFLTSLVYNSGMAHMDGIRMDEGESLLMCWDKSAESPRHVLFFCS
jgi:hypothetical protein